MYILIYYMKIVDNITLFVNDIIKNIYNEISIYRSVLVTNNYAESIKLKKVLSSNDFDVLIIKNIINENIEYDNIDKRIVIVDKNLFRQFVNHIKNKNKEFSNSSYNFIGICYTMNKNDTVDILDYIKQLKIHNEINLYYKNIIN